MNPTSLNHIASFMKVASLAFCAASPRARIAVERSSFGGYKCGPFRVTLDALGCSQRTVTVAVLPFNTDEDFIDTDTDSRKKEAILDWWLLRRSTWFPIAFTAYTEPPDAPEEDMYPLDFFNDLFDEMREYPEGEFRIQNTGLLPALKALDIQGSTCNTISWLSRCTSLESLNLNGCSNIADFTVIGSCGTTLKHLTINRKNNIVDIICRSSYQEKNTDDLTWLGSCVNLQSLSISGFSLTQIDYSHLGKCIQLRELSIDCCETIAGFSWMDALQHLNVLAIGYARIEKDSLAWVRRCLAVDELYLYCGHWVRHTSAISDMPCIERVHFHGRGPPFKMPWIATMPDLQYIYAQTLHGFCVMDESKIPKAQAWRNVLRRKGFI